jgi:hypothetical protein
MKLRSLVLFGCVLICASLACSSLADTAASLSSTATANTFAPTNTLAPTNTVTKVATPEPKSAGPCDNILFPLIKGNRWYFQKETGGETSAISLLVDSVAGDKAILNIYGAASDLTSSSQATCKDGAILNFPANELGMLFYSPAKGSLTLQYQSGEFFPAEKAFIQSQWNHTWKTELLATGSFHVKDPESGLEYTALLEQSPVTLDWHTAGAGAQAYEAVTVPAGDFPQALKIFLLATLDIKLQLGPSQGNMTIPAKIVINSTLWFEPHEGLLKEVMDSLDVTYLGATFAQDVQGSIVLKKYSQQK